MLLSCTDLERVEWAFMLSLMLLFWCRLCRKARLAYGGKGMQAASMF
jgi:hypothetical protein